MAANNAYKANTAPSRAPRKNPGTPRPDFKSINSSKSEALLKQEERQAYKYTFRMVLYLAIIVAFFSVMILSVASYNAAQTRVSQMQKKLDTARSEYVRLNMEASSKETLENALDFAASSGMVEQSNRQVEYIQVPEAPVIEEPESEQTNSLMKKFEKNRLLSYIFNWENINKNSG